MMGRIVVIIAFVICNIGNSLGQKSEQDIFRLALSQTLKEEFNQALTNFNEIIAINPTNWDAYLYRSLCHFKTKNYKKAIEDCNVIIKNNPLNAKAYYYRGLAKGGLNNHSAAIQDFTDAIALDQDEDLYYYERGQSFFMVSDYPSAINDYSIAIAKNQEEGKYMYKLGVANYLNGNREIACKNLQKAAEKGFLDAYDLMKFYCN
jgi:tetratricopeptide (TPR) repeat protein